MPNSGKEVLSSITKLLHSAGGSKEQLSEQSTSVEFKDTWTVRQSGTWTVKCSIETSWNGSVEPFEQRAVEEKRVALLSEMQALQTSIEAKFVNYSVAGLKDANDAENIVSQVIRIARLPVRNQFNAELLLLRMVSRAARRMWPR